jgi:hypothetical protein
MEDRQMTEIVIYGHRFPASVIAAADAARLDAVDRARLAWLRSAIHCAIMLEDFDRVVVLCGEARAVRDRIVAGG